MSHTDIASALMGYLMSRTLDPAREAKTRARLIATVVESTEWRRATDEAMDGMMGEYQLDCLSHLGLHLTDAVKAYNREARREREEAEKAEEDGEAGQ